MCAVCVYPWRLLSEYVELYGLVGQVTLGVVIVTEGHYRFENPLSQSESLKVPSR